LPVNNYLLLFGYSITELWSSLLKW